MSDAAMRLTAIAPWFGSKRNLAAEIVRELGPHSAYWEPFCGSMAVLLNKPPAAHEHVCDLHGDLINLARVVQCPSRGPALYRRLRRTLFNETFHAESKERLVAGHHSSDVDRAYDYFVMSWMGRNGVSGTCAHSQTFARRWTPHGGQGGKRFASAVDSLPAWRRRLRFVNIEQHDGLEALERIEDCRGVVIYCDPPYLIKGAAYMHDFKTRDHVGLARRLRRFKVARVVVSYYDHPWLARLYPGWTIRKIEVSKATAASGSRGPNDVRAVECLIINGPSYAEPNHLFAENPA